MNQKKNAKLIEFKGSTFATLIVTLRSLEPQSLTTEATQLFGDDNFFDGDTGILDLSQIDPLQHEPDWSAIRACFAGHGLSIIGISGASPELQTSARSAGLPVFPEPTRPTRPEPESKPAPAAPQPETITETITEAVPPASIAPAAPLPALVVNRPLRSGQHVYAQNRDLVILAAVNPGAEVIADGNIYIYAPLRGRALAGAAGNTEARIFATRFEAELVSIAGVYRTFESGLPGELAGLPVQVKLGTEESTLELLALKLD